MTVKLTMMKKWELECPACGHIEASEAGGELSCGNCGGGVKGVLGVPSNEWESDDARKSWRAIRCAKGCGWECNKFSCSKCGTSISGDFIKGSGCFVATACFEDVNHPTVEHLRAFRDLHLSRYSLGQAFIAWYYKNAPSYANRVSSKPRIKASLRVVFNQLVKVLPRK